MVSTASIFSDTQNHWARPFIQALRERGIVNGFQDGTFRPDQPMTRAEFATVLQKAFTRPKVRQYVSFIDVPANFWAANAIKVAFESGFLSGLPNRRFLPQDKITRVQALISLVAGLQIASAVGNSPTLSLSEVYTDASQVPTYAIEPITVATRAKLVVNSPNIRVLNPNRGATRGEVSAFLYQALVFLEQAPLLVSEYIVELPNPKPIRQGTQVSFNGKLRQAIWSQWSNNFSLRTGISDAGLMQTMGVELSTTTDATKQPGTWFSPSSNPLIMATRLEGGYRYLEISDLVKTNGWQMQVEGSTLKIVSQLSVVKNVTVEALSPGSRIVVDLAQPTPYQVRTNPEWSVTLDASADPTVLERFKPPSAEPVPTPTPTEDKNEGETGGSSEQLRPPIVESADNQTVIRGNLPDGFGVRVSTLANPSRLIIELRPDALIERDILWAPGLRWRSQYLNLGTVRFPVIGLSVNLRTAKLNLRPIWANPATMTGTAPLIQMAQKWQAFAAVNGGFFNRNNLLPLGAIRRDRKWLSGPILNRGAIAWNDTGGVKMGRLTLEETLITSAGQRLPVLLLNTGYVQRGIARYTPEWGVTYTPLSDNETLVVVQNNQVTSQTPGGPVGKTPVAIPRDGYLLTLRANPEAATSLNVGTKLEIQSATVPAEFSQFPHILGAGPLLLQNGQAVLDAKAEGFSDAFVRQAAIRSAIGTTAGGELLIVTVHNRIGGSGPSLSEVTQLMQQLGAVDALNLDGGSSTSLYLGGQLVNRSPETAARVHNGLAIFFT